MPEWIHDSPLSQPVGLLRNLEHLARSPYGTHLCGIGVVNVQRDPDGCGTDRLGARRAELGGLCRNADLLTFDQEQRHLRAIPGDDSLIASVVPNASA